MNETYTRYFYDTEFLEDGSTIDLISIGICCEDGREYYAVNSDADWDRIRADDWLMDNVVRHLPTHSTGAVTENRMFGSNRKYTWGGLSMKDASVKPKWVIANEVRDFLLAAEKPELWAWYGAYDHVALCQLWGKMIGLPKGVPMWTNDLRQEVHCMDRADRHMQLPEQAEGEHNALADARHLKVRFEFVMAAMERG